MTQFARELADKLRGLGAHLPPGPGAAAGGFALGFDAARTAASSSSSSSSSAAVSSARLNDLRDRLRVLQDRSHSREPAVARNLACLGYLEISLAAVAVSLQGQCRDSVAATYALQALSNLAMEGANRQRLADLGAVELSVAAVRAFEVPGGGGGGSAASGAASGAGSGGGARVVKDAVVAIRHLAYEMDANKARVLQCGGVAAIVRAMGDFAEHAQLLRQCAGALALLSVPCALGDAARAEVIRRGGLRALHAALARHRADGQVVAAVARAVATIFSNGGAPEARALAKELATVELIEAVLAEHGGAAGQGEVAESLRAAARKIRLGAQAAAQQAQQEAAAARR